MKEQIIAIGGGGFTEAVDDLILERYILEQSKKTKPKVCFIASASGDSQEYIDGFYSSFANLSCETFNLSLFKLPTKDLEGFILEQDVLYVGGGNTRSMLALWREWGLDVTLRKAWQLGIVLGGVSSGSVCWFEETLSDFLPGELGRLRCLGFLAGSNCPHYDTEPQRRPTYRKMVAEGELAAGIAADDGVALHYVGTELLRVVSSRPRARAYKVIKAPVEIEETITPVYLGN